MAWELNFSQLVLVWSQNGRFWHSKISFIYKLRFIWLSVNGIYSLNISKCRVYHNRITNRGSMYNFLPSHAMQLFKKICHIAKTWQKSDKRSLLQKQGDSYKNYQVVRKLLTTIFPATYLVTTVIAYYRCFYCCYHLTEVIHRSLL